MRKGLLSLAVVALVLVAGYVLMQHTVERKYRAMIAKSNSLTEDAGFALHIHEYQYRFFGARVEVGISTPRLPELQEVLAQVRLESVLHYGPLLRFEDSLHFGVLHSQDRLMTEAMDEWLLDIVNNLFDGQPPLEGESILGFGNQAQYWLRFNAAETVEEHGELHFDGLMIRGVMNVSDMTGSYDIHGGAVSVETPAGYFSMAGMEGQMILTGMVGSSPLGTTELTLHEVRAASSLLPEVRMTLHLAVDTQAQDGLFDTDMKLTAEPFHAESLQDSPLAGTDRLTLQLAMRGLGLEGLNEVDALVVRLQDVETRLYAADLDEVGPLVDEMDSLLDQVARVATQEVLQAGRSSMTLNIHLSAQGEELLALETWYGYVGLPEEAGSIEDLAGLAEEDWLRVVDVDVTARLHASVVDSLSDEQQEMLAEFMPQGRASVVMRGGVLTLNDEEIPPEVLASAIGQHVGRMRGHDAELGDEVSLMFGSVATSVTLAIDEHFHEQTRLPSVAEVADMVERFSPESGLSVRLHDFDTQEGVLELMLEDELGDAVHLLMVPGMPDLSSRGWIEWNCQYSTRDPERYQLWFVANCETLQPLEAMP